MVCLVRMHASSRWNYTAVWNITGFPAAAVPVGSATSEEYSGLPTGVQVAGLPDDEDKILALASALCEAVAAE